jgi:hypothetical protein
VSGFRVAIVFGTELDEFIDLLSCERIGVVAHGLVRPPRYHNAPPACAAALNWLIHVSVLDDYGRTTLTACFPLSHFAASA